MHFICLFRALLIVFFLFFISPTFARQADTSGRPTPFLLVSGAADVYYRYDPARTASNALTSFTRSENLVELNTAQIKLEHRTSLIDMVADLAAGPRQNEYAGTDKGIAKFIRQLYISYSPLAWLKFTGGTWATHLCYESPDASANRNYSMSYLFSNDPFSHMGIKAEVSLGSHGFMVGVANPCNYRAIPDSGRCNKNIIAQYSYTVGDRLKISLNYQGGRDIVDNRSHQYDVVFTAKISSLFSLGWNATVQRSSMAVEKYQISRSWYGSAVYVNYDPKKWLGVTVRTEYFNDKQGVCLPAPASVLETTLSANLKAWNFTVIPEFRIDHADNPIFFHASGSPATTAGSFLLAAVFSF